MLLGNPSIPLAILVTYVEYLIDIWGLMRLHYYLTHYCAPPTTSIKQSHHFFVLSPQTASLSSTDRHNQTPFPNNDIPKNANQIDFSHRLST
jgi:hypothetical protein